MTGPSLVLSPVVMVVIVLTLTMGVVMLGRSTDLSRCHADRGFTS
jgi:hypothetical protein